MRGDASLRQRTLARARLRVQHRQLPSLEPGQQRADGRDAAVVSVGVTEPVCQEALVGGGSCWCRGDLGRKPLGQHAHALGQQLEFEVGTALSSLFRSQRALVDMLDALEDRVALHRYLADTDAGN